MLRLRLAWLEFYAQRFTELALFPIGLEFGTIAGTRFLVALWLGEVGKLDESC